MIELVSWNMNRRAFWDELASETSVDVALLQEAPRPPESPHLWATHPAGDDEWRTEGWQFECRTCVVQLSDRVTLRPRSLREPADGDTAALGASRSGSLTVADVIRNGEYLCTVASGYANWESSADRDDLIFADASAHRLLSDLSSLVTGRKGERLLLAGDFNILHGYGEHGDTYWGKRYQSVFDRAEAMGLRYVGPQHPNGRQASPPPSELPEDSLDVPTFRHSRQTVEGASRQMDFVFATSELASLIETRAQNDVADWGPSDHCRVRIVLDV
jgi:exonuclease III